MKKKAINFDLDTNKMDDLDLYPKGYELLRNSFTEAGFVHRQGSGYMSNEEMTEADVYSALEKIALEQPWIADCVKAIDVTEINWQHDVKDYVKEVVALSRQAQQNKQEESAQLARQGGQVQQSEPARQVRQVGQAEQAGLVKNENTKEKLTAEDEKLVARIRKTPKGAEFDTLYNGGEITGDRARDDFKLMNALGFFSDKNREQMQRIFQSSGRYRPELGREYLDRLTDTVLKAYERPDPSAGGGRSNSRGNGGYKGK